MRALLPAVIDLGRLPQHGRSPERRVRISNAGGGDLNARAADLFARLASGDVKAHVGQRVALKDAAVAHRELESRRTMGATVLLP